MFIIVCLCDAHIHCNSMDVTLHIHDNFLPQEYSFPSDVPTPEQSFTVCVWTLGTFETGEFSVVFATCI